MNAQSPETPTSIGRGHPRLLFATLMVGQMSQGLAFTAFLAALPQMAQDLGPRGPYIAQMTMALASLGLMFGSIISGWVLEKGGARVTLIGSVALFGVAGAGGIFLQNPWLLLASRFIVGFASACLATMCMWGISAEYEGNQRARTFGISAAISNCTSLICVILGGYLAQLGGWRLTFIQYPAFGAVAVVLGFISVRQARPQLQQAGEAKEPYLKQLLPFYLLAVLLFAVMFMASTQFAFMLEDDGINNPSTRSLFMGTVTVLGALISFCYGPVQQRLGVLGTFTVATLCQAVALACIGRGVGPAFAILGAVLMGVYTGLLGPFIVHVVTERTSAVTRSRAIGLVAAFGFLGGFLNPVIFAPMSAAIGLRNVFLVMSAVMTVLCLAAAARWLRGGGAREVAPNHL
jgi:MFS family permease